MKKTTQNNFVRSLVADTKVVDIYSLGFDTLATGLFYKKKVFQYSKSSNVHVWCQSVHYNLEFPEFKTFVGVGKTFYLVYNAKKNTLINIHVSR